MILNKDAESWAKVLPTAVLTGSAQQSLNVLTMALEDIQRLEKERFKYETCLMLISKGYPGAQGLAAAALANA